MVDGNDKRCRVYAKHHDCPRREVYLAFLWNFVSHGLLLRKFGLEFLRYDEHTGNGGIEFPDLVQQFLGLGANVSVFEFFGIVDGDFHGANG